MLFISSVDTLCYGDRPYHGSFIMGLYCDKGTRREYWICSNTWFVAVGAEMYVRVA